MNTEKAGFRSYKILFLSTLAFMLSFSAWTINGILIAFLVDNNIFKWSSVEVGWLLGIPVLSGAVFRFPVGILTDKFGGKIIFTLLLMFCSVPMYLLSFANDYLVFAILSFCFGIVGSSFACGVAYVSLWFPKKQQGTALGIFGVGTIGTALTALFAPRLLNMLTDHGMNTEGWRYLPQIYAAVLLIMGIVFFLFSNKRLPEKIKSFKELTKPLKQVQVWRFGLYYFLVFGCFVAFSQWLIPYYVNAYYMSLITAGLLTSAFSLPSGLVRALGGWLADKFGPQRVLFNVFSVSIVLSFLLISEDGDLFPRLWHNG